MADHTPGSWTTTQHNTEFVIWAGNRPLCVEAAGSGDDAKANARLIAAAPTLLENLNTCAGLLGDDYDLLDSKDDAHMAIRVLRVKEALIDARAALAQARGEAALASEHCA